MTATTQAYGIQPGTLPQTEAVVPLTALYPMARVDLLPPEVPAARRFRAARLGMVGAVGLTVLVAALAYLFAWRSAEEAADELAAEQQRTVILQQEEGRYAEVPLVLGAIDRTETALGVAMGTDIAWYPYLYQLSLSAPEGVWFEKVTFTALTADTATTDPLAPPGAVATVQTVGRALDYPQVVAWADEMDVVTTFDHVLLADAADDPTAGAVTFTTTARLSADAYSHRYDPGALVGAAGQEQ